MSSTIAFVAGVAVALLGACLGILVYARTTVGGHLLATASAGSRVRLHSSLGVYLTVSASDGAVRLGGNNSGPEAWLLVPVAPSMVALLSAREAELQLEADGTRPSMVTRSGCHCNGFSNAYGFGGHCAAWEEEYEAPWCYVDDDCAAVANKGSFGLKHQRCDAEVTGEGGMYQDDLGGSTPYAPLAGWRAPDGSTTGGFAAVHAPPTKESLLVHARDAGLSIHSLFAKLPTGHFVALGTRALLGLCAEQGTSAPLLCTGYRSKPNEPHRKLLRTAQHRSALTFAIEHL